MPKLINHVVVIGSLPESLLNFRGELILKLLSKNCKVSTMAAEADPQTVNEIKKCGASFQSYPISRNGLNPFDDLRTWLGLRKSLKDLKPDIIFAYTIKPVIWAGIASRVLPKVKFYPLITGLGFAFKGSTFKRKILSHIVTLLYKVALKNARKVIFQNPDDRDVLIKRGIIDVARCEIVNGSGVDISKFKASSLPKDKTIFLSIGRLLGEKGFREYAEAAQIVRSKYPEARFQILGPTDPSPDGIPVSEVRSWHKKGFIEYLGSTNDVRPFLEQCSIYVLPSYYGEGLPRSIIEAMATARPILTTDNVGCRETVVSGKNGFLVPIADSSALAERMIWFIENRNQWDEMANLSRQFAEEKYDVHKVNERIMEIMWL